MGVFVQNGWTLLKVQQAIIAILLPFRPFRMDLGVRSPWGKCDRSALESQPEQPGAGCSARARFRRIADRPAGPAGPNRLSYTSYTYYLYLYDCRHHPRSTRIMPAVIVEKEGSCPDRDPEPT